MRYLQTLVEIGAEQNTIIAFPLPIDLITPMRRWRMAGSKSEHWLSRSEPSPKAPDVIWGDEREI